MFTMIFIKGGGTYLNELDELNKIEQFGWDRLSEKRIKDNKVCINFSSFPSVCLL